MTHCMYQNDSCWDCPSKVECGTDTVGFKVPLDPNSCVHPSPTAVFPSAIFHDDDDDLFDEKPHDEEEEEW